MSPLNNQQKQLLFDYCIGLTSAKQTAEAEALISSNAGASEIHSKLKSALAPLASIRPEPCPDDLAERTILRLNNFARSSQLQLQQLLAGEQARGTAFRSPFWRSLGKMAAAAAVFLIALGTFHTSSNYARHRYYRNRCQAQLGSIFRGLSNYISDYDDKLPTVATVAGAPWWKVGYQGKENHSNTRHIWLLVKGDYVDQAIFICPGGKQKIIVRFEPSEVQKHNDFLYREQITYSFRICSNRSAKRTAPSRRPLMSDLNTVFEMLPRDYSTQLGIPLDKDRSTLNSINHNRRGQNILFDDGCVEFCKKRCIGTINDDPFTLQNTNTYNGTEVPSCEEDSLLAP